MKLSPREREVYELLVGTDLCVKDIAARIGISPNTVTVYVTRIYRASGVHSRLELVMRSR